MNKPWFLSWVGALALSWVGNACAQEFSALVTPPRFEIKAKPGQTLRQVLEIANMARTTSSYRVYTADWSFDERGNIQFYEDLRPGSCRPWVAIERNKVTLPSKGKKRFRYEVNVPAGSDGSAAQECRFAIMVEGTETSLQKQGNVQIPVSGRIGVIVYVGVGALEPQLSILSSHVDRQDGQLLPVLVMKNSGTATGRLSGLLKGKDAKGQTLELSPSTLPILPGQQMYITLSVNAPNAQVAPATIEYPIKIKGNLEWGGRVHPFEQIFHQQ